MTWDKVLFSWPTSSKSKKSNLMFDYFQCFWFGWLQKWRFLTITLKIFITLPSLPWLEWQSNQFNIVNSKSKKSKKSAMLILKILFWFDWFWPCLKSKEKEKYFLGQKHYFYNRKHRKIEKKISYTYVKLKTNKTRKKGIFFLVSHGELTFSV